MPWPSGRKRTDDERAAIGAGVRASRDYAQAMLTRRTWSRGRPLPADVRARISAVKRADPLTAERMEKLAAARRGVLLTPEHRRKISAARRRPLDPT